MTTRSPARPSSEAASRRPTPRHGRCQGRPATRHVDGRLVAHRRGSRRRASRAPVLPRQDQHQRTASAPVSGSARLAACEPRPGFGTCSPRLHCRRARRFSIQGDGARAARRWCGDRVHRITAVGTEWAGVREVVLRQQGDPPPNGLGCIRVMRSRGIVIEEEITAFEPPKYLAYRLVGGIPVRNYEAEVRFDPSDSGTSILWIACASTADPVHRPADGAHDPERPAGRPGSPGEGALPRQLAALNPGQTKGGNEARDPPQYPQTSSPPSPNRVVPAGTPHLSAASRSDLSNSPASRPERVGVRRRGESGVPGAPAATGRASGRRERRRRRAGSRAFGPSARRRGWPPARARFGSSGSRAAAARGRRSAAASAGRSRGSGSEAPLRRVRLSPGGSVRSASVTTQ